MYAPVLKKFVEKKESFIERCLPVPGNLFVKEGDPIRPFDRLGECNFSQKQTTYPKNFKPSKMKSTKQFYYQGSNLGKLGKASIPVPFNGNLTKIDDGSYILNAAESKFVLLSGVWGTVHKVSESRAVLIKTQTKDLLLASSTPISISGELVVFPNPMEILEKYYLESFSKNNEGKIVYVGHFASLEVIKRAHEMGAAAVLTGSAHKETFNYAKSNNLGLGLISGFGKLDTPEPIYKLLSTIAHRYVFLDGEKNVLRIPHNIDDIKAEEVVSKPEQGIDQSVEQEGEGKESAKKVKGAKKGVKKTTKKGKVMEQKESEKLVEKEEIRTLKVLEQEDTLLIKEVLQGMDILSLQAPNFGKIGTVDSVLESSIFVKFNTEKVPTEIKLPNFFIIE